MSDGVGTRSDGAEVLSKEAYPGCSYTVKFILYRYLEYKRVRMESDQSFVGHLDLALGLLPDHVDGIPRSYK
jgi:hypothetical protein